MSFRHSLSRYLAARAVATPIGLKLAEHVLVALDDGQRLSLVTSNGPIVIRQQASNGLSELVLEADGSKGEVVLASGTSSFITDLRQSMADQILRELRSRELFSKAHFAVTGALAGGVVVLVLLVAALSAGRLSDLGAPRQHLPAPAAITDGARTGPDPSNAICGATCSPAGHSGLTPEAAPQIAPIATTTPTAAPERVATRDTVAAGAGEVARLDDEQMMALALRIRDAILADMEVPAVVLDRLPPAVAAAAR